MNFPFIGGRVKPDVFTENIARNLNLELTVKETSSTQKAWNNVKELIDNGQTVGLLSISGWYQTNNLHNKYGRRLSSSDKKSHEK